MQVLALHSPTDLSHTLNCLSSAWLEPLLTIAASVSLSLQVRQSFVDFNLSYVSLLFFAILEGNKDLEFCFSPLSILL